MDSETLNSIFQINTEHHFNEVALKIFQFQFTNNKVYNQYVTTLGIDPTNITHYTQIPFLPIEFFKSHKVYSSESIPKITFYSSGTTGKIQSKHLVKDLSIYKESFLQAFKKSYGSPEMYCVLALLPNYQEREGSSLIYMVNQFIEMSHHSTSGFYLNNDLALIKALKQCEQEGHKTILIGVSFALLDLIEKYEIKLSHTIIMETGGMKGRRKELTRKELHHHLKEGFGVENIHSEYGMTELLSQAYSKDSGFFNTPPWMKLLIRETADPYNYETEGKTGGVNVIDLANVYSCSFLETKDLGKLHTDGQFEIVGRFDNSDIRGCNLLIE